MARAKSQYQIEAGFVEVAGRKLVILDEEQYDRLLDAVDAVEAEKIAGDPKDRILRWDEIKGEFIVNRIAEVRERMGITQKELARRLKVRQSTVSRMEHKNANLTLATLRKIAKALGCSVHQLIS
jgi:DNA-binding XRE family transcriptional regulator